MSVTAMDLTGIAASPGDLRPLAVGEFARSFTVRRADGALYRYAPGASGRPTLMVTYRGGWCPYCNAHLAELRHVVPELRAAGVDVLFLSADRPELLLASLKNGNAELDYLFLSDAELSAAIALGVASRVPDEQMAVLRKCDIDLKEKTGHYDDVLPIPAVFVLDEHGRAVFAHVDSDYRQRLSAAAVRAAVAGITRGPGGARSTAVNP